MKKIRSEFLTKKEAEKAIDKIDSYCKNLKIIYNNNGYDNYDYGNYIKEENYFYIPEVNSLNFGMFGLNFNPNFNSDILEEKYNRNFSRHYPYQSIYNPKNRVILEADVADDNYEYIKDKLYSIGAISVT